MSSEVVTNLETLIVKGLKSWSNFIPTEIEDYPNPPEGIDIEVELRHLSKPDAGSFLAKCQLRVGGKDTGQLDMDKYFRHLAPYIESWKFTVGQLRRLIPIKNDQADDAQIECNNVNKILVLRHVPKFDDWVLKTARQLGDVQKEERDQEQKNS